MTNIEKHTKVYLCLGLLMLFSVSVFAQQGQQTDVSLQEKMTTNKSNSEKVLSSSTSERNEKSNHENAKDAQKVERRALRQVYRLMDTKLLKDRKIEYKVSELMERGDFEKKSNVSYVVPTPRTTSEVADLGDKARKSVAVNQPNQEGLKKEQMQQKVANWSDEKLVQVFKNAKPQTQQKMLQDENFKQRLKKLNVK